MIITTGGVHPAGGGDMEEKKDTRSIRALYIPALVLDVLLATFLAFMFLILLPPMDSLPWLMNENVSAVIDSLLCVSCPTGILTIILGVILMRTSADPREKRFAILTIVLGAACALILPICFIWMVNNSAG